MKDFTWKDVTPARALGALGGVFLAAGFLILLRLFSDTWSQCLLDNAERAEGLARLFLVLGTSCVGLLAWIKR